MSFKNIISGDVRYILAEKLECKDLWNLSKVVGERDKWIDLINRKVLNSLKSILQSSLTEKYNEYVISGTFILQSFNRDFQEFTIDIFIPLCDNKICKSFHKEDIYSILVDTISGTKCISKFSKIKNTKYNIQTILVDLKREEMLNFVCKNFQKTVFHDNKLFCDYEEIFKKIDCVIQKLEK